MNLRVYGAALALPLLAACGGTTPASSLAKAPEYRPEGLSKCTVAKSQAEPLVVEWSGVDRAKLEALAQSGVVPVKYLGCEMQVLSRCTAQDVKYRYVATTLKHDEDHIRTEDELYAKLPLGAVRLEGTLRRAGELSVGMTIVGRYQAGAPVNAGQLHGECEGATHVITALTAGAFEFSTGAEAKVQGEATAFSVGGGAASGARREVLSRDGLEAECAKATPDDVRPPAGCGALIRVELAALPEAAAHLKELEHQGDEAKRADEARQASAGRTRTAALVVGGIGLALVGGGLASFLGASSAQSSIEEGGLASGDEIDSAGTRVTVLRGLSIGLFGIGGAAVLTGAGMLLFGPSSAQSATAARWDGSVLRW